MQICPIDREWIHTYILEPYAQGCELIDLFWKGIDRSLECNPISWIDRVVYLIQGVLLMIPLINTIIWLAWQTFGNPQKLADPYCPEIDTPTILPSPAVIIHRAADGRPLDQFGYIETVNNAPIRTSWALETFPDVIIATQNANTFSSTSLYRPDLSLNELHYQSGNKRIDLSRAGSEQGSQIQVTITDGQNPPVQNLLDLPRDGHPWIQQRAIGFKPFVLSAEPEMEFYAVVPEYPSLVVGWILSWLEATPFIMNIRAIKRGIEGGLMKVEIVSMKGWPYDAIKSELWFDPTTGLLRRFIDSGTFIPTKTGILAQ